VRFAEQHLEAPGQQASEEAAAGKQSLLFLAKKYSDLK
jgi:hypothetical protein